MMPVTTTPLPVHCHNRHFVHNNVVVDTYHVSVITIVTFASQYCSVTKLPGSLASVSLSLLAASGQ